MGNHLPDSNSERSTHSEIRFHTVSDEDAGNDGNQFDPVDDERLIRRAFLSSPEEGCKLLFTRYHRALCSHALRYVYSREVAEDIVSEVFCRFWKNKSFASVTSSYRYYLFRSVRNEAYSYLRSEFRQLDSLDTSLVTQGESGQRPDSITQYEETYNRVKELVEQLPPQCRKVFLMSRFEGMRYKEIASEMGISVKTVDTHLVKALKIIRKGLVDYLPVVAGAILAFVISGGLTQVVFD